MVTLLISIFFKWPKNLDFPKTNTSYITCKPLALSWVFCKLIEHVSYNRLNWFVEEIKFIPDNLFTFWRVQGAIECLSFFCWQQYYQSFCNEEYLSATFIDIKRSFDSIHIPTLISRLIYLCLLHSVWYFILSLYSNNFLTLPSSSGFTTKLLFHSLQFVCVLILL